MENTEKLKVKVDDLIILCHILDKFEQFKTNFIKLRETKKYSLIKLEKISRGQYCFNSKRIKDFYKENKTVIDTINKYSNIGTFIFNNYEIIEKSHFHNLEFFHQYILKNKDKLDQILLLLEKIKGLGIEKLKFDENMNLTNDEYTIYTLSPSHRMTYFDNIEVIPNYEENTVKYKTTGSNYKIKLENLGHEFSKYGRDITVNTLLFDPKRSPEAITKECIIDKILELKSKQKEECSTIKNSVDLSICVSDLHTQILSTNKTINALDNIKNKTELLEVLSNIMNEAQKLKAISIEYNNNAVEMFSTVTQEIIKKEKELYLVRRFYSSIDID